MSSNTPQVMVVTSEGNFYVFNIDLSKGGEGTLTKQYSYVPISDFLIEANTNPFTYQCTRFKRQTGIICDGLLIDLNFIRCTLTFIANA